MNKTLILATEIVSLVKQLVKRGARPFTIKTITPVRMLVKSRANKLPYAGATWNKVSVINCMLNTDYAASVNRQLTREGKETSFTSEANWFDHTDTKSVVTNKDKTKSYLQLKIEKILSVEYRSDAGDVVTGEVFRESYADFLPLPPKENEKQGTEKPILTMTVGLPSIREFSVDDMSYVVEH